MPRYVIHIGPHKTGTTYLQTAFRDARPALAALGVIYPEAWLRGTGHADLPVELEAAAPLEQFAGLNRHAGTVLISAEDLSYGSRQGARRLRALTQDHPATIVYYARNWIDVAVSDWRSRVKRGLAVDSMAAQFLIHASYPHACPIINPRVPLDVFAEAFGAENIRVACYDDVTAAGIDLLDHFCGSFLGIRMPAVARGRVNPSPDAVDAEMMRAINIIRAQIGLPAVRYAQYRGVRGKLDIARALAAMQAALRPLQVYAGSRVFAEINAAAFDAYRHGMVPPHPDGALYASGRGNAEYVRDDYMLAPGVVRELRAAAKSIPAARAAAGAPTGDGAEM